MKKPWNYIDVKIGTMYGKWKVINSDIPYNASQGRLILCQCVCDKQIVKLVKLHCLLNGVSTSCGCGKKEVLIKRNTKHGLAKRNNKSHLYHLLKRIKQRCIDKNDRSYKNYGGRGISICNEWLDNPILFVDWCLNNGYKEGLQIDRINNDGNYEPNNCRFVTLQENCFNKRLLQSNNISGYRGVYYKKCNKKYGTIIKYKRKIIYNKTIFKTAKAAALARDIFIIRNDLPHNLNFPELQLWSSL